MPLVLPAADVLARNHVRVTGDPDGPPVVFAHGFACDQRMWRLVAPAFEADHRVVLFDHVGAGNSDLLAYDADRHAHPRGYAEDLVEVLEALDLRDAVLVGHSFGSMVCGYAQVMAPERVRAVAMVGPSPCYIDEPAAGYVGGFSTEDISGLLETLDANYLGWSSVMAPTIMGNPDRPALGAELEEVFCATDPDIASRWARATFLTDCRADLASFSAPTLVMQCSQDPIVPDGVGHFVAEALPAGTFVQLAATGHVPNLSAPVETATAIRDFLADLSAPPAVP